MFAYRKLQAMWQVSYRREAVRTLGRIDRTMARRIRDAIEKLAQDPYAPNPRVAKLQGRTEYRLRIGDWRVIYDLVDDEIRILVLRIAPRGEVYRQ